MRDIARFATVLRLAVAEDHQALEALQQAAYAPNRVLLGVEPLPLLADYRDILATMECWLAECDGQQKGALILASEEDALLIWSVSIAPDAQGTGLGKSLMQHAENRARDLGHKRLTLYTGEKLTHLIRWYQHLGFGITGVEALDDRNIIHLEKPLGSA